MSSMKNERDIDSQRVSAEEEEDKEMRDGDYDGLERSTFDEAPRPFLCSFHRPGHHKLKP